MKKICFLLFFILSITVKAQEPTSSWYGQIQYGFYQSGRIVSDPIQFNGDDPEELTIRTNETSALLGHRFKPRWSWEIGIGRGTHGYALAYNGTVDQFIDTENPLLSSLGEILNSPLIAFIPADVDYELQVDYWVVPFAIRHQLHSGKWFEAFAKLGAAVIHVDHAEEQLYSSLVNLFITGENTLLRDRSLDVNQWNVAADVSIGVEARLDDRLRLNGAVNAGIQFLDTWEESTETSRLHRWGFVVGMAYQL